MSGVDEKINITWRVTENSEFIYNLFDRDKKINHTKSSMSNHSKLVLEMNNVRSQSLNI